MCLHLSPAFQGTTGALRHEVGQASKGDRPSSVKLPSSIIGKSVMPFVRGGYCVRCRAEETLPTSIKEKETHWLKRAVSPLHHYFPAELFTFMANLSLPPVPRLLTVLLSCYLAGNPLFCISVAECGCTLCHKAGAPASLAGIKVSPCLSVWNFEEPRPSLDIAPSCACLSQAANNKGHEGACNEQTKVSQEVQPIGDT
eukprot:1137318-Pelagomonas_calceolata.AAC.3